MSTRNAIFEVVTGKNDREEYVFSVIVKRSYLIKDGEVLQRRETDHELRKIDAYYDNGDPEWSVVQFEQELAPFKPLVDVVVIGKAYAPGGEPVQFMTASVQVGKTNKKVMVFGDRYCHFREDADPVFSDPEPFSEMEIRYDLAYGGADEETLPESPLHYPRNFMGKGVVLRNIKKRVEGLLLPNIEDPEDLLTPERVVIGDPERWHLQPIPQGFGWRQRTWYPRSALLGSFPAYTDAGAITPEEKMGYVPLNHIALAKQSRLPTYEALFNNGASLGLYFESLNPFEEFTLQGLTPEGTTRFLLAGDKPEILLDIGRGEQQLESRLHTVSIRPDDGEVDLIWRGAYVYEGYRWWPKMQRLHAEVN